MSGDIPMPLLSLPRLASPADEAFEPDEPASTRGNSSPGMCVRTSGPRSPMQAAADSAAAAAAQELTALAAVAGRSRSSPMVIDQEASENELSISTVAERQLLQAASAPGASVELGAAPAVSSTEARANPGLEESDVETFFAELCTSLVSPLIARLKFEFITRLKSEKRNLKEAQELELDRIQAQHRESLARLVASMASDHSSQACDKHVAKDSGLEGDAGDAAARKQTAPQGGGSIQPVYDVFGAFASRPAASTELPPHALQQLNMQGQVPGAAHRPCSPEQTNILFARHPTPVRATPTWVHGRAISPLKGSLQTTAPSAVSGFPSATMQMTASRSVSPMAEQGLARFAAVALPSQAFSPRASPACASPSRAVLAPTWGAAAQTLQGATFIPTPAATIARGQASGSAVAMGMGPPVIGTSLTSSPLQAEPRSGQISLAGSAVLPPASQVSSHVAYLGLHLSGKSDSGATVLMAAPPIASASSSLLFAAGQMSPRMTATARTAVSVACTAAAPVDVIAMSTTPAAETNAKCAEAQIPCIPSGALVHERRTSPRRPRDKLDFSKVTPSDVPVADSSMAGVVVDTGAPK